MVFFHIHTHTNENTLPLIGHCCRHSNWTRLVSMATKCSMVLKNDMHCVIGNSVKTSSVATNTEAFSVRSLATREGVGVELREICVRPATVLISGALGHQAAKVGQ